MFGQGTCALGRNADPGGGGSAGPERAVGARARSGRWDRGRGAAQGGRWELRTQAAEPNEDQTSSLVPTRSMTASVNSVVPAWPPRSGVLVPEPTVSRADS